MCTFSVFLFFAGLCAGIAFLFVLGRPGDPRTHKIYQNHSSVARKQRVAKTGKEGSGGRFGLHFGGPGAPFSFTLGYFWRLGLHFGASNNEQNLEEQKKTKT